MAGIYLHIPFCKSRCIYCDFYSTTHGEALKQRYVDALCHEIEMRKTYLGTQRIHTVYVGGGTPSQLTPAQFSQLFDTIDRVYGMAHVEEVTVEVNPDDLSENFLRDLASLPVNRISMGVQTFDDGLLRWLHRRHDAAEAIRAVDMCREAGFQNISIDLIYGLPGQAMDTWQHDIDKALELHPSHLSAYSLSYEEGTPLWRMLQRHEVGEADEQVSLACYTVLMERLRAAGYEHYEISNFAIPGFQSKHNSSYWNGTPYLGCGAAAHSFNGQDEREWNVSNLYLYIIGIEKAQRNFTTEHLSVTDRYNERVMTSLRTSEGIDIVRVGEDFGDEAQNYMMAMAQQSIESGKMQIERGRLKLTRAGIFISDDIMSNLFK